MTADLKAKWIAALRSGDCAQGQGCIRRGDSFCCIGVWEHVATGECHESEEEEAIHPAYSRLDAVTPYGTVPKLVDMNDQGKSFAEIADWIEIHVQVAEFMNREQLIDHVAERLDGFAAVMAVRKLFDDRNGTPDPVVYETLRREHAARIVDAVRVLGDQCPKVQS